MSSFTGDQNESVEYKIPDVNTLQNAVRLSIVEDKPLLMDYWLESIEKDVTSQVFVDDGYFLFREWYKTSGSNSKIPQKKDFIKNLNSKFGKVNSKNYWRGIKFVKKEETIDDED